MGPHTSWNDVKATEIPRRRKELAKTAAPRRALIAAVNLYRARTGLSMMQMAQRASVGYSTLVKFLNDRYEEVSGSDSHISKKLLAVLETAPVDSGPEETERMYEIGNLREMREVFRRALERPHIFMVYGPPGAGKTGAARHLISEHNRLSAKSPEMGGIYQVYCRAAIRPMALVRRVAVACGAATGRDTDSILNSLLATLRGRRVVIVFDEAQHLDVDCMETIRELYDVAGISLVFAGSHELERIFDRFRGTLEQLERRVTDKISLPAVARAEAVAIIREELGQLTEVDDSLVAHLVEAASVSVRVGNRRENYISIGRLMATVREAREGLDGAPAEKAEVTQ
jgi:hypothetical protein